MLPVAARAPSDISNAPGTDRPAGSRLVPGAPAQGAARALLLAAARLHGPGEATDPYAAPGGSSAPTDIDWAWILDQARHHGLLAQLQALLGQGLQAGRVPASVRDTLTQQARGIAVRALQQARELVRLTEHLNAAGHPVLVLKGPVLAQLAYDNVAFRPALDLDLLVRPDALRAVRDALRPLGYTSLWGHDAHEAARFMAWHRSYELIHPARRIIVELHANFFATNYADIMAPEAVWARQQRVPLAGTAVQALALEDLLIYLAVHGTKHRWTRLKWIADVAGLIRRQPGMDWSAVFKRADEVGARRAVQLAVWLARRLLGAPAPVKAPPAPTRPVQQLADAVVDHWLFASPDAEPDPWRTFWFHWQARERWRDRWPHLRHAGPLAWTPTETDRAFLRLPPALEALYVLVRPVRVLWERLTGRASGPPAAPVPERPPRESDR